MAGGSLQLVAVGSQDAYLTGNPQITFFKVVYRRHTNFAMESIQQFFRNEQNLDFGKSVYSIIERKADLMSGALLEITLPALDQTQPGTNSTYVNWVNGIGNALIKSMSVRIGGYTVDTQSGEWMDIHSQYNVTKDKRTTYDEMTGYRPNNTNDTNIIANKEITFHIPLNFWFSHPGLALPIEALQYHDVEIHFTFAKLADMIVSDATASISAPVDISGAIAAFKSCKLYVDYIFLDTNEKRNTMQSTHEYLIEQVQTLNAEDISAGTTSSKINLFLKHPVKALYWVISNTQYTTTGSTDKNNQPLLYDADIADVNGVVQNKDTFNTMKLICLGADRFTERPAKYFRLTQPFQYFKCCPNKYIYCYSFGLRPCEQQPSGTCNFSRIDNVTLSMSFNSAIAASKLKIYAVNYNVLSIMSGMSSVLFA
jgi:Major capsid protein N-terminus/Large eukaryotic DNA virus major capsid protein